MGDVIIEIGKDKGSVSFSRASSSSSANRYKSFDNLSDYEFQLILEKLPLLDVISVEKLNKSFAVKVRRASAMVNGVHNIWVGHRFSFQYRFSHWWALWYTPQMLSVRRFILFVFGGFIAFNLVAFFAGIVVCVIICVSCCVGFRDADTIDSLFSLSQRISVFPSERHMVNESKMTRRVNIVWLLTLGVPCCSLFLLLGLLQFATIIGMANGVICFQTAVVALRPFGRARGVIKYTPQQDPRPQLVKDYLKRQGVKVK